MEKDTKPTQEIAADSIVLEEEIDPNYVPSEPEVVEYAKWLGMDLEKDKDLFWVAREGLMAPLPKDWKPCKTKDTDDVYYFNFTTGESTWDHPCDGYYKRLYEEEKKKKETVLKESGDQNRSKAKQDVEQLLGKAEKKKKKRTPVELGSSELPTAHPAPSTLQRKPLPDILGPGRQSSERVPKLDAQSGGSGSQLGPDKLLAVSASLDSTRLGSFSSLTGTKPLGSVKPITSGEPKSRPASASVSATAPIPSAGGTLVSDDMRTNRSFRTDVAEEKPTSQRDREGKLTDSDGDKELGALPVTAALNSQSRTLTQRDRSSSPNRAASKRAEDSYFNGDSQARGDKTSDVREMPESARVDMDLQEKCASLAKQAEESARMAAQYQASYVTVKDELKALERRYEASQVQWQDKLRAVETDRDSIDSERRRLKFELMDVQQASAGGAQGPGGGVGAEETSLGSELRSAQAALARSAATHAELQDLMRDTVGRHREQLAQCEAERAVAVTECERLTAALREVHVKVADVDSERFQHGSGSGSELALSQELDRKTKELAAKEAEVAKLGSKVASEQARCTGLLEQIMTMSATGEAQVRALTDEIAALAKRGDELQAKLVAACAETDSARAKSQAVESACQRRTELADAQVAASERLLSDMRTLEANLRKEVSDLQRRKSEDQEQILALQAERTQFATSESERGAQFESFATQATAVRKSLKAEIERLKAQLLELETEKSSLVTQLTRQETSLQFAKKELNESAALRENFRQLEAENQQLGAQLETLREGMARQSAQESALKERCERLTRSGLEEEEIRRELRAENTRLSMALEGERSQSAQKEKKIKSYQEEVLQLQRRLAESAASVASPTKEVLNPTSALGSVRGTTQGPEGNEHDAAAIELQIRLSRAQADLVTVTSERDDLKRHVEEQAGDAARLEQNIKQLEAKSLKLQEQLAAKSSELDSCRQELSEVGAEVLRLRNSRSGQEGTESAALQESHRRIAELEREKSVLVNQSRELSNQLDSMAVTLDVQAASKKLVEAEVLSYKDKWVSSEKELSELRLAHTKTVTQAEVDATGLRSQLAELQVINEVNARSANELRYAKQEISTFRTLLAEKEGQLAAASAELHDLRARSAQQEFPAAEDVAPIASTKIAGAGGGQGGSTVYLPSAAETPSSGHHIVALSMEVGRQQVNMQRMEEHLRQTERLLLEFRSKAVGAGTKSSTDDSILPSALRRKAAAHERGLSDIDTIASPESVSFVPPRKESKERARRRSDRAARSDPSGSPSRGRGISQVPPSGTVSVSREWMASVVRSRELHFYSPVTLRTGDGSLTLDALRATAVRVVAAGKARLKSEVRFLRELQVRCGEMKVRLLHEQDAAKRLKAQWRAGRDRPGRDTNPSTAEINAFTARLNVAVDELRAAQAVLKAGENRSRSLSHLVQHLEEMLEASAAGGDPTAPSRASEMAARIGEVASAVQRKCQESAQELTTALFPSGQGWPPAPPKVSAESRSSRFDGSKAQDFLMDHQGLESAYLGSIFPAQSSVGPQRTESAPPLPPPSANWPRDGGGLTSGIRRYEARTRILQSQIGAITQRQSQSRDACEKHAGWLDALRREISGASHSYPQPSARPSVALLGSHEHKENGGPAAKATGRDGKSM